jgi:hypothetical protein
MLETSSACSNWFAHSYTDESSVMDIRLRWNVGFSTDTDTDTDTDISQHTPYQGFSVTGYIMNR